jgi:hypothetical protein
MGFRTLRFLFWISLLSAFAVTAAFGSDGENSSPGFFSHESHRFGITYTDFSGDKDNSLTGNSGYGVDVGISRGNSFVQILTKVGLGYSRGNSEFLDSATKLALDYKFLTANAGLGLRFDPVMAHGGGFGIYFGAVGTLGMAQLSLPDRTYTKLVSTQTALAVGYDLFAGIEMTHFYIEAALRNAQAKLGGSSNFQLGGLVLQGGLTW